jgi:hypothetical protein
MCVLSIYSTVQYHEVSCPCVRPRIPRFHEGRERRLTLTCEASLERPASRAGTSIHWFLSPPPRLARRARVLAVAPYHACLSTAVIHKGLRAASEDARANAGRSWRAALGAAARLVLAARGLGLASRCGVGRPKRGAERRREGVLDVGIGGEPAAGGALVAEAGAEVLVLARRHEKFGHALQEYGLVVAVWHVREHRIFAVHGVDFVHDLLVIEVAASTLIVRAVARAVLDGGGGVTNAGVGPGRAVADESAVLA